MTDPNSLIRLNIELEGLLRILADRDNADARALLEAKFAQYSDLMHLYLAQETPMQSVPAPAIEPEQPVAPEPEAVPATEPVPEPIYEVASEPDVIVEPEPVPVQEPIIVPEPEPEPIPEPEPAQPPRTAVNTRLLKAFTLNDKFRFRRELFNGDDDDFADTLSLLAHMPSYAEAADYLTNDLLWDTRNPNVEDFLAILKENM